METKYKFILPLLYAYNYYSPISDEPTRTKKAKIVFISIFNVLLWLLLLALASPVLITFAIISLVLLLILVIITIIIMIIVFIILVICNLINCVTCGLFCLPCNVVAASAA